MIRPSRQTFAMASVFGFPKPPVSKEASFLALHFNQHAPPLLFKARAKFCSFPHGKMTVCPVCKNKRIFIDVERM